MRINNFRITESQEDYGFEVEEIREDWKFVLGKVQSVSPRNIAALKDMPIIYEEDIDFKGADRIAEIRIEPDLNISLVVSEDYFRVKKPIAIGILLHELGHALIVLQYILKKDIKGLLAYQKDNGGHNYEWKILCDRFESYFKNVKIPVTLDLNDDSIYEV